MSDEKVTSLAELLNDIGVHVRTEALPPNSKAFGMAVEQERLRQQVGTLEARVAELEEALGLALRSVELVQGFEFAVGKMEQRLSLYASGALSAAERLGVQSAKGWTYEECEERIRAALSGKAGT